VIFSSWGCVNDKVYKSNHGTEEQTEDIRTEIVNISAEQLQRINQNLFFQCEECLHVEGQNFQHLL
jgi:hypothetical protein